MHNSVWLNSLKNFCSPSLKNFQKPGRFALEPFSDQVCFVTDFFLYFLVFLTKLPLIFLVSQCCHEFVWKTRSILKTELFSESENYITREKAFNQSKQLMISENEYNTKGYKLLCYYSSTSVPPIYTFSLAGNINVYTPIECTNSEKCLTKLSIKEKCRLWREINTSPSISSFIDRVFSIFRQKKVRVKSVRKGYQIGYHRTDKINNNMNKRRKQVSSRGNC